MTPTSPTSEFYRLQRSPAPLAEAAKKIAALKLALSEALADDPDTETRASGEMLCPTCGDPYRAHPYDYCATAVVICTGQRFKI